MFRRLPIRNAGDAPGNGFTIRCAYACENLGRYPGWWHTGENWHRDGDEDSAGAEVIRSICMSGRARTPVTIASGPGQTLSLPVVN